MDRDACLLVNPAAGGGKAARVLGDVEAELRRLGVAFRTEQTTSLLHATELARAAAERGEAIVTLSGDGLIGSVVGTLKDVDGALLGVLPGGRGNDLARVLGIPLEAVPACEVIAAGTPRALDIGEVEGRSFIGIASPRFLPAGAGHRRGRGPLVHRHREPRLRLGRQQDRQRGSVPARQPRLCVRRAARPRLVAPCDLHGRLRRRVVAHIHRLERRRLQLQGVRRRDVRRARRRARRRPVRRRDVLGHRQAALPAPADEGLQGDAHPRAVHRGPQVGVRAHRRRPAVHGLRGRGSDRRPPAHDARGPPRARRPVPLLGAKVAAARAVGALSRRTGRGGTSLPGKLLMRLEPDAISQLAGRLPQGNAVLSATNGKTTTAAMVVSILGARGRQAGSGHGLSLVHNRAGANMAGGVATALLEARGDMGLFEVDEFWLDRVTGQLRPRALLLANLFRDQLDRYGELESIADRWSAVVAAHEGALVLNADDPLVADLGRGRPSVTYFGVQDDSMAMAAMQHAADSKHCRRCGAAYVYDAIYLGHLGRYHCPTGDARRPDPDVFATDVALDGTHSAAFTL